MKLRSRNSTSMCDTFKVRGLALRLHLLLKHTASMQIIIVTLTHAHSFTLDLYS